MNYFDQVFFQKYVHEGDEIISVCHRHPLLIVDRVVVTLFLGLLLPAFFYYNDSFSIRSIVPFLYFEAYVILLYFYLIYKIFDWYNDVWIITDEGVIDVDWNVFTRHVIHIEYQDIKGTEIVNDSIWDSLFHKGDIILHTYGDEDGFILEGAENPEGIAEHIDEVIHEITHAKPEKPKEPMEVLIHTLSEVVRDHLNSRTTSGPEEDNEEEEKIEEIKRTLQKKGTIDLR